MARVVLDRLCKQFPGGVTAVDRLDLDIADGEFVVLLGPSGCGKTTALQMIAGLEVQSSGRVLFGDRDVSRIPPDKRDIAMVFQSYALYPNMTVYDNIAFGLKMRRTPKRDIDRLVREAASVIGLQDHLKRKPGQLSGGQRQRVALGRALVRRPQVFLLDEPLSNVDAKLRAEMRINLKALHNRLRTTFIYVTHDQVEAMSMADRIAVMNDGVLQQFDTPTAIYNRPASLFVAGFIGSPQMNLVHGTAERDAVTCDAFRYPFRDRSWPGEGAGVVFGFRPSDVRVQRGAVDAAITGQVEFLEPLGSDLVLSVRVGEQLVMARADPDFEVNVGELVGLEVAERRVHLFDADSGARLDPVPEPERVA